MPTIPNVADEIANFPAGARFFRSDLHIHSYGASHDVTDPGLTPQAIAETAERDDLSIIAITDHNEITNVAAGVEAGLARGVVVIPAVELSTPQGHLLVYFSTLEKLQSFYGRLNIAGRGTSQSRCSTGMLDCLAMAKEFQGFGILAHVDGGAGLEEVVSGYPAHKADIICHPALLGLELRSAQSQISFSDVDPEPQRSRMGQQRIDRQNFGQKQFLARVLFSDAHSLLAMGKNARGAKRVTKMKMDSPSFEGVRVALQDSDARTRLEDEIPESIPHLMGMKITGGFLDGQVIHFSRNLNCIIGGRGAGKSTALEAARVLSPTLSSNRLVDSEAWPEVLHLVWIDETGQQHTIRRRLREESENIEDPILGPTQFPMECYGQNETAQTSDRAEKDPSVLLRYLDQFTGVSDFLLHDDQMRDDLLANQSEIEKAQQQVNRIPEYKKLLNNTQQQLKTLESANAADVIALERKVAEERQLRKSIDESVQAISAGTKSSALPDLIAGIYALCKPEDLRIGPTEFTAILADLKTFQAQFLTARSNVTAGAGALSLAVKKKLQAWKIHEQEIATQIEQKKRDLLGKGIRLDSQYIKKLASDESSHKKSLATLAQWEKKLKELRRARRQLIQQRTDNRAAIFTRRTAYACKANKALRSSLRDLSVDVKFVEGALSQEAEDIITEAMNWRTSQVPRAALILGQVTMPTLLSILSKKDSSLIARIIAPDNSKPFSSADAREIVDALSKDAYRFRLERCIYDDLPRITVTKKVTEGGQTRHVTKNFGRLSLGQQQSVLLALMLSSDSRYPLVIDQPEDNLDSEFIFHSLVPVLRAAKEMRQVIIVTHNPNIAVLGDAEKILALKSTSQKSVIVADGSIDNPQTRTYVCQILEGAEEAFRRRAKMYGVI